MSWINRVNELHKEAKESIIQELKLNNRTYISLPTGSGKTNLGISLIKELNMKTLWLTQGIELIKETKDRFEKEFKEVGIWQADNKNIKNITIGSIQTIQNQIQELINEKFELVIVDEAHHSAANGWLNIIQSSNYKKLIGLTATPNRYDNQDIGEIFGNMSYQLSHSEAEDKKIIAKSKGILILTNSSINGVQTINKDYSPSELEKKVICSNRNNIIVNSYLKHTSHIKNKKTICYCVSINHAKILNENFLSKGISSAVLYGNMDDDYGSGEREFVYQQFKESKIEVLCVNNILNEGKDIPDTNILLLTRPTMSPIIYTQQLGRGSRFIEVIKEELLVLDYVDNCSKDFESFHSKFSGSGDSLNIDIDYYNGNDYIEVIKQLDRVNRPDLIINRKTIISEANKFIQINGNLTARDLGTNSLPTRRVINNIFGSYQEFRKEIGLSSNEVSFLPKTEVEKKLKDYYQLKGSISTLDLGRKNNLPSIKVIKKYWKTFFNCAKELSLTNEWILNNQ